MDYTEFLSRTLIALLLSFLVGLERQWRRRSVGLRTNVLVCLGAFLFTSLPVIINNLEDMKVAAQVVSGIGFLGAGVILKDGVNIRGLNTAATLWCNAAIGVLCAAGLILEAATGCVLILSANIVLRYIMKKIVKMQEISNSKDYLLTIVLDKKKETILRTTLIQMISETNIKLNSMEITNKDDEKAELIADVSLGKVNNDISHIITRFTIEPDVFYVGYRKIIKEDEEYN